MYRFALQSAEQPLGLPVGQHVFVRLRRKDTGEMVQRAYTPVSRADARGSVEFLIKCVLCDCMRDGGAMLTGASHTGCTCPPRTSPRAGR